MKIRFFILLLAILISALSPLSAQKNYILWNNACAIAEANYTLVPGKTHQVMLTTDDKSGKILQSSDLLITHHLNEEGEIVSTLIDKQIDGEDADHPDNDRMIDVMLQRDLTPNREGLFFTEVGKNLQLRETNHLRDFNGFNCVEYEMIFIATDEDDKEIKFNGSVWLEENSGAPIYNIFRMDKTPRFVKELIIERWYHFEPETNEWYLQEMVTTAEVRFLLKRLTNKTTMTYSDYWRYEPETID